MSKYVSVTDTAVLVRKALKRHFPKTKFSVRSHSYSMGAAVRVNWTDGPTTKEVDTVVGGFAGGRFDGMIDLAYNADHWLLPDGTSVLHGTSGHSFSDGNEVFTPEAPAPGAELVNFGADYVTTNRTESPELRRMAARRVAAKYGLGVEPDALLSTEHGGWSALANTLLDTGGSHLRTVGDALWHTVSHLRGDGVFVTVK